MIKTIKELASSEIVVKKSKFIANVIPINSEEEAKNMIREISKKYHDAKHNCYAYRVEELENKKSIERFSDNGEPSGTAGSPILEILKKQELNNILVIVTRYFGGILLGTGGLVRAYSEATKKVLEEAKFINKEVGMKYIVEIKYDQLNKILYFCNKLKINVISIQYEVNIILILESNKDKMKELLKDDVIVEKSKVIEDLIYIEK